MEPQPSQIAHYRITGKLGEGGMGAAVEAEPLTVVLNWRGAAKK